jgi:mono/diheme cytochrome c family protein
MPKAPSRLRAVTAALAAPAILLLSGLFAAAQSDEGALKKGQALYSQYCRSCHGDTATGDGPAATALKIRPADLTQISKRHGGFPTDKVMDWIDGEKYAIGHGSREMPVWGKRFRRTASGEIRSLAKYLESIQR